MFPELLRLRRQILYAPALFMALQWDRRWVSVLGSLLLAGLALYGWSLALRRSRALADTPTTAIASAAQGYVALRGRLKPVGYTSLTVPSNGMPCVWYREVVEELDHEGECRRIIRNESQESLRLVDRSGECLIVWDDAEILSRHRTVTASRGQRTTAHWLAEGEAVSVVGELHTRGLAEAPASINQQVGELLADWKADPGRLRARFDRNGDGEISAEEWEEARVAARAEVVARLADPGAVFDTHLVLPPRDGRPFIVSALEDSRTAWHYRWSGVLDLVVFFAGLLLLGLELRARFH